MCILISQDKHLSKRSGLRYVQSNALTITLETRYSFRCHTTRDEWFYIQLNVKSKTRIMYVLFVFKI